MLSPYSRILVTNQRFSDTGRALIGRRSDAKKPARGGLQWVQYESLRLGCVSGGRVFSPAVRPPPCAVRSRARAASDTRNYGVRRNISGAAASPRGEPTARR